MSRIKLKVLKVSQPIGEFFVASMPAKQLVEISFSDVRRLVVDQRDVEKYLGIQRPVNPRRIADIKKYLEGPDATFPTSVIIAIDERCAEYEETHKSGGNLYLDSFSAELGSDESDIPIGRIAKVLDGQHRIAAFMDDKGDYCFGADDNEFDINLAIFVGADIAEQANIFATVNLAQTKVNKSLAYDLTELAKKRSPHKTCHDVAVMLDGEESSPLYERIKRLGTATPGRTREPLTQAAFVESLVKFISTDPVDDRNKLMRGQKLELADGEELLKTPFRNLFIKKKDMDIAEILFNYFMAVRNKWPESWGNLESGNLLPKSNAFKALMKFLKEDVYPELGGKELDKVPTAKKIQPFFDRLDLKDSDFTTQNFVPGSGGQAMFLKMLRQQISRKDMLSS